jgi:hypothetical protein
VYGAPQFESRRRVPAANPVTLLVLFIDVSVYVWAVEDFCVLARKIVMIDGFEYRVLRRSESKEQFDRAPSALIWMSAITIFLGFCVHADSRAQASTKLVSR